MRTHLMAISLATAVLASLPAAAQPAPPSAAQGATGQEPAAPAGPVSGADQVVGLFGATCLHFAGDVTAMRGFLQQQGAPEMPQAARDAFLAGRHGHVFDVSYQSQKLALVSVDDGGCEAVAEQAAPQEVLATLQQAARENNVALAPLDSPPNKRSNVQLTAYGVTLNGKPMHVLVSTETTAPQAVLTLIPK